YAYQKNLIRITKGCQPFGGTNLSCLRDVPVRPLAAPSTYLYQLCDLLPFRLLPDRPQYCSAPSFCSKPSFHSPHPAKLRKTRQKRAVHAPKNSFPDIRKWCVSAFDE